MTADLFNRLMAMLGNASIPHNGKAIYFEVKGREFCDRPWRPLSTPPPFNVLPACGRTISIAAIRIALRRATQLAKVVAEVLRGAQRQRADGGGRIDHAAGGQSAAIDDVEFGTSYD